MKEAAFLPALAAMLALGLAGCELRQDADGAASDDTPLLAPEEEPDAAALEPEEPPVASIIRDEAPIGEPIAEPDPEPLKRVVPFAGGGNDLSTRAERILAGILESDAARENWPITLRGHTDAAGNDRANLRAARARAEAVAAWLVNRGVDDERITVIPMGEQNPVAPNALPDGSPNEEGRAKNRRVEVEIAPPPPVERTIEPARGEGGATRDGARKTQRSNEGA